ncbi:hypothetical protein [Brevundimonas fluminis]|jgi:F-type H+-transporting ATPase subunit b|uniref:F0F1 ATP synthase subunit B family protein n=1 Tax=Brevundimonas fluminis TaxID=2487274 RepID=UPI000F656246|nr:hypothetical protein [Brevundimonas fluminis]
MAPPIAQPPGPPEPVLGETPAEAAAQQTHASTEVAHGEAHGSGGLPQFEFQHWFGQIVYLIFLFAVLYFLIAKVFAPRMRRVFDERSSTISGAVDAARQVQAEAAGQAEAAKREVDEARAASRATAQSAKDRVTSEAAARAAAEEAVVAARIAEAEGAIARTRDAAMANVSTVAADAASAMVERLTGKAPTAAELKGVA